MTFPETRLTLIQRLASRGDEHDWQSFLTDYWGPVCRFALRWGAPSPSDAEDVAAEAFEVLWTNRLLVRWISNRSAKLRTLLCAVVRNILSNDRRAQQRRGECMRELFDQARELGQTQNETVGAFYAAWADDLLQRAMQALAAEYCAAGKADYVRVLHGRLCQRLTIAEVARALQLKPSDVDNYYRHAREQLSAQLKQVLRRHVERYTAPTEVTAEVQQEWRLLGEYLLEHGGLEQAVSQAQNALGPLADGRRASRSLAKAIERVTSIMRAAAAPDAAQRSAGDSR